MPPSSKRPPNKTSPTSALPELKLAAPRDFSVIPTTNQTLVFGYGKVGEAPVLVPYVELELVRAVAEEAQSASDLDVAGTFHVTVGFENVAYLLMDIARDFRLSSERLALFATGEAKPEPVRIDYARRSLESAKASIEQSIVILQSMSAEKKPSPSSRSGAKQRGRKREAE